MAIRWRWRQRWVNGRYLRRVYTLHTLHTLCCDEWFPIAEQFCHYIVHPVVHGEEKLLQKNPAALERRGAHQNEGGIRPFLIYTNVILWNWFSDRNRNYIEKRKRRRIGWRPGGGGGGGGGGGAFIFIYNKWCDFLCVEGDRFIFYSEFRFPIGMRHECQLEWISIR